MLIVFENKSINMRNTDSQTEDELKLWLSMWGEITANYLFYIESYSSERSWDGQGFPRSGRAALWKTTFIHPLLLRIYFSGVWVEPEFMFDLAEAEIKVHLKYGGQDESQGHEKINFKVRFKVKVWIRAGSQWYRSVLLQSWIQNMYV